jgi:hypothetical protein
MTDAQNALLIKNTHQNQRSAALPASVNAGNIRTRAINPLYATESAVAHERNCPNAWIPNTAIQESVLHWLLVESQGILNQLFQSEADVEMTPGHKL